MSGPGGAHPARSAVAGTLGDGDALGVPWNAKGTMVVWVVEGLGLGRLLFLPVEWKDERFAWTWEACVGMLELRRVMKG